MRAVHFYRYMTAADVRHLFFSPSSLTHVRSLLSLMCGGRDYAGDAYLYRFCLPGVSVGNPERVYILGKRGREFLESEGLSVGWYFRPEKVRRLSYSQMIHNLSLTRFLVAARRWADGSKGVRLRSARICYELGAVSVEMEEKGRKDKDRVVPDAWLLFEKLVKGKAPVEFPVRRPHQVRHLFDLVLTHLEWDTGHTLQRRQRAQLCASWGGGPRRRGHSLAGYNILWKALPIARSEETTVTAQ